MIKEKKLGDCIDLVIDYRGKTPGKLGGEWVEDGIRVISALNVHNGMIDNEEQIRCVSKDIYDKWMQEEIHKNDCFLASEGASLGENTIWDSDEKVVLGQRLYAIRTNPDVLDPWYFAMYMQTGKFREQVDQVSTGSTVFGISQPILLSLKLLLPEIEEQRTIGQFYRNIRTKIINNNSICSDLEKMAKLLYDYWFVQFDFPDENGKPYKSSGGKMVWNEELKREIPEGWEVNVLHNVLCLLKDGTHNPPKRVTSGIPLLTGTMFGKDFLDYSQATYITESDYNRIHSQYKPQEGDIILTKIGTIGSVNYLRKEDIPIAIHCNSALLRFPDYMSGMFALMYCKSEEFYKRLRAEKGQSIQEFCSLDSIGAIKMLIPPKQIIERFNNVLKAALLSLEKISTENQELASLRDFLLPMLMNGQVKVQPTK